MDDQQKTSVERVLRTMAARIEAAAPEGWRRGRLCTYRGTSGSGGGNSFYEMADGHKQECVAPQGAKELYALSGASTDHLTIELTVEPSGRFEAVLSQAITRKTYPEQDQLLYVLRPDHLPVQPGAEQDGPSDPTPAGDPEEAVRLFRQYLQKRADIHGEEEFLPPPLDPVQRAALLDDFQGELPPDLVALYGEADGDDEIGLFHGHPWFGLESTTTHIHHHYEWKWTDNPLWAMAGEAEPPETIRRWLNSPNWIPFATSTGGDYLAVDMDPGPAGRPGQVIRVGRNYRPQPVYVADSVTTMLRQHVTALDRGDYWEEDGYLDVDVKIPSYLDDSKTFWRGEGPIPKKPHRIHTLVVDKVKSLDLEAVRRAPHMRAVMLFGKGPVDLRPLLDIPLEVLHLHLDAVDLQQIAGHPTLRVVQLSTRRPVDLSALRTFPRLEGLELSGAVVQDVGTIADLSGLLSLTLSYEQWQQLDKVPLLAAAGLGGDTTLSQVNEWAARFEPDELLGGYEHFEGQVHSGD
ncbi:SMI1/KNR4 family protein [Streptomyces sp. C10]|uniref:SMI1/KNR4 family protein n=1 Tax=Streptomyces sp. C10 TaxID=531941 RepID=UPI00397FBDBF